MGLRALTQTLTLPTRGTTHRVSSPAYHIYVCVSMKVLCIHSLCITCHACASSSVMTVQACARPALGMRRHASVFLLAFLAVSRILVLFSKPIYHDSRSMRDCVSHVVHRAFVFATLKQETYLTLQKCA